MCRFLRLTGFGEQVVLFLYLRSQTVAIHSTCQMFTWKCNHLLFSATVMLWSLKMKYQWSVLLYNFVSVQVKAWTVCWYLNIEIQKKASDALSLTGQGCSQIPTCLFLLSFTYILYVFHSLSFFFFFILKPRKQLWVSLKSKINFPP